MIGSLPEGTVFVKELTRVLTPMFQDGSRTEAGNRSTVDDGEPVTPPGTEIVNRLRDPLFPSAGLALYEDGAVGRRPPCSRLRARL